MYVSLYALTPTATLPVTVGMTISFVAPRNMDPLVPLNWDFEPYIFVGLPAQSICVFACLPFSWVKPFVRVCIFCLYIKAAIYEICMVSPSADSVMRKTSIKLAVQYIENNILIKEHIYLFADIMFCNSLATKLAEGRIAGSECLQHLLSGRSSGMGTVLAIDWRILP